MPRQRVCVYCGSSAGNGSVYLEAAVALGKQLAAKQYDLVYGGASIGLMGAVADSVLQAGGDVIGIIPESIADKEVAHPGLTKLEITRSMHERKTRMAELSDAFIALPGGLGTLEELFEMWTWAQLGFHRKAVGLLNINGYFDGLVQFLDKTMEEGFVKAGHRNMLIVSDHPAELLERIKTYTPTDIDKLPVNDRRSGFD